MGDRGHSGRAAPHRGTGAAASESAGPSVEAALHQRLRDLTLSFSQGVTSPLGLDAALQGLAFGANDLFGAHRTSVWLHRRRDRELTLTASSDAGQARLAAPVSTDDPDAPAARGLRLDKPAVIVKGRKPMLLVPLRGCRRALGTLIVEGPFTEELGRPQLIDLAHELGRQLSAAVENVQLLQEILQQRRLLEDTFNSLVDPVVVTDTQMRVVQMNDAFIARVGLARAELLDRSLDTLVGHEMAAWVARDTELGDFNEYERTSRFEDERLGGIFTVTVTPLLNQSAEPTGHVVVARDITHQTRLEREREALRERLGQSEKLASLGQFVAGIAHEMNNPLQGVLGYLELMIETVEAARPLRRDLRRIYQEADRAAKIVRNLLVFTGSRRMTRRRLKLNRILSRVIASRARELGRAGIEIVRHDAVDLPSLTGDPLLLHQAFLNILINAEQAVLSTGTGGRIEITSRADASGTRVITTVRDSGPGIPPHILPRIFDPFFTTKEVGKGTGLGLAITYGIVQDHGGVIYAENAAEGGALFSIELPVTDDTRRSAR